MASFFPEIAKCLREEGNPKWRKIANKNVITALHQAASKGNAKSVKKLLTEIDNRNARNKSGLTPLHKAALNGHTDIIKLIFDVVDEKNPKDDSGSTPLHLAAKNGHMEIVKMIMEVEGYCDECCGISK